jgi:hypothetical protein
MPASDEKSVSGQAVDDVTAALHVLSSGLKVAAGLGRPGAGGR